MSQPIQNAAVDQFKGALNQAIASLAVAKAAYSAMMLTVSAVQLPSGSGDKGYINLVDAGPLLEMAHVECMAAIFERAKEDARREAAAPKIVSMDGGRMPN
jgi:hypothetical protein